jgi:uncharacterized protein
MFSFSKLLILAVLIAAVWFGFRWYTRLEQSGRLKRKSPGQIGTHDTVRCASCGVYVTKGSGPCGRADCPDPGRT